MIISENAIYIRYSLGQGVATFCLIPNRTIIISFLYILFRKGCIKMSATELTKNLIENYG